MRRVRGGLLGPDAIRAAIHAAATRKTGKHCGSCGREVLAPDLLIFNESGLCAICHQKRRPRPSTGGEA